MIHIYIDGGARGNPGSAALGFVVTDDQGNELYRFGAELGRCTNNIAEYASLIEALKYLNSKYPFLGNAVPDAEEFVVHSDSELVVRQMSGRYRVRDPKLVPLHREAKSLIGTRDDISLEYVPRSRNRAADAIVNRVLDGLDYFT
jgi:ribonuclease HI